MLTHELLERAAARTPGQTAVICETRATFADVERTSAAAAFELGQRSISRGDRVALLLENSLEFVVALFGVLKAGAVAVPLNPATKEEKLAYILDDCGAAGVFARGPALEVVARASALLVQKPQVISIEPANGGNADALRPRSAPPVIDDDLALVLYTSGTTGRPKGVMLTHRTVCNNAWAIGSYLGNDPHDVVLCTLPLSFSYGLFQVLTAAEVGHAVVLERSLAFPADTLRRIANLGVTGIPGVPTTFATLLSHVKSGDDLASLRYITNAGAALPAAHLAKLRKLFPSVRIYCMYGQTECTRASYLEPELLDERPGSVGRAIPNSEIYLVDEQGRRLPPDSSGELVVRGANVMRGYWGRPVETAAKLRDGEHVGEKVLHTGDMFEMDSDGYLTFQGRSDDVFKSNGQKVSPLEIESVIYELAEVAEVAVVGIPDPIEGLSVKAYVAAAQDRELDATAIRRHCRARLEPHLVPREVEIVPALPKTDSGKMDRSVLRARCVASPELS